MSALNERTKSDWFNLDNDFHRSKKFLSFKEELAGRSAEQYAIDTAMQFLETIKCCSKKMASTYLNELIELDKNASSNSQDSVSRFIINCYKLCVYYHTAALWGLMMARRRKFERKFDVSAIISKDELRLYYDNLPFNETFDEIQRYRERDEYIF